MLRRFTIAQASAFAALASLGIVAGVARGDEPKATAIKAVKIQVAGEEKKTDEPKAEEKKADEVDIYAVPTVDDVETLVAFIKKVQMFRPTTLEAYQSHMTKSPAALKTAAEKILKLEKDKDSAAYKLATLVMQQAELQSLATVGEAERAALYAKFKEKLASSEKSKQDLAFARQVASLLERSGDAKLAAQAYSELGAMFAKSDDKEIAKLGEKLVGAGRRMNLVGNEMTLEGKTFDGKPFNLTSLKGKVVLVDFWATWCGPCLAEHPNVEKNYKAYHNKGFEVVGVSLDEKRQDLEKFISEHPVKWITLHENDGSGWDHPAATHYGIMGIPTVILINKEGKVISLRARGPELGKLLEQELGAPEPAAEETSEVKKE